LQTFPAAYVGIFNSNAMKNLFVGISLLICFHLCAQPPLATIREFQKAFDTYPFSDPSPLPQIGRLYPYFRFDGFTNEAIRMPWKVVEMENDFIKLWVLPEIGGKIWSAQEKSTGRYFIYHNQVVKFRDVAMRGPWTSGGIEANYGIIGHTPNCATPVDYQLQTHPDGSVSCVIGTLDLLTRSTWRVAINLPADKAFFTTRSFWHNGTPADKPYYHWMNAALPVNGNLEFLYPGNRQLGHDGEYGDWPANLKNGKNIRYYNENDFGGYKSYHVFGTYTHFFGAYYHDFDFGTIRYSMRDEKPGKKLWIWGLSRQGMIWENLLTDSDGQYFELQSGRLFNQNAEKSTLSPFKHRMFAPYSTDVWTEYWYPILGIKGAVEANEYGALHVGYENGWLKIRFCPVQAVSEVLSVRSNNGEIYTGTLNLKPLEVFIDSVRCSKPAADWKVVLGDHKLHYDFDEVSKVMERPVDSPADFNWESPQGLYMLAYSEMAQKLFPKAEAHLRAALDKDPHHFPALILAAQLMYSNMRYRDGLEYAKRALSIDTHDGAANYYYGLLQEALGKPIQAKDGFDLAAQSIAYRSAAYTSMSRIYLKEANPGKAVHFAEKALDFNQFNSTALQYKAIAYRRMGNEPQAERVLKTLEAIDEISHFVNFEKWFSRQDEESRQRFASMIRNEMPHETFLELALFYLQAGGKPEALRILEMSPPSVEVDIWLTHLKNGSINWENCEISFVFPFRAETGDLLEKWLSTENHWKLRYLLALVYTNFNRIEESRQLLASCGNAPDFAAFYVLRSQLNPEILNAQKQADLERAMDLSKDWRYVKLLADYFMENKQPQRALSVLEPFYIQNRDNYIIGLWYAKALLQDKRYAAGDKILAGLNLIPFEGATESRDIYRESKLMQALELILQKKYIRALPFVEAARLFPEHLGVGSPYPNEIDYRIEDALAYVCYVKSGKPAAARQLLERMGAFSAEGGNIYETNFLAASGWITAWALAQLGRQQESEALRTRQPELDVWYQSAVGGRAIPEDFPKSVSSRVLFEIWRSGLLNG
jgi:predicted Zn-dependent protease